MTQFFLHLVGDYMLQNAWMSANKKRSWAVAYLHALVYGIPFVIVLSPSWWAWSALVLAHLVVDRFQLAALLVFWCSRLIVPDLQWKDAQLNNGFPTTSPVREALWVSMVVDNALHLVTNYAILTWL